MNYSWSAVFWQGRWLLTTALTIQTEIQWQINGQLVPNALPMYGNTGTGLNGHQCDHGRFSFFSYYYYHDFLLMFLQLLLMALIGRRWSPTDFNGRWVTAELLFFFSVSLIHLFHSFKSVALSRFFSLETPFFPGLGHRVDFARLLLPSKSTDFQQPISDLIDSTIWIEFIIISYIIYDFFFFLNFKILFYKSKTWINISLYK